MYLIEVSPSGKYKLAITSIATKPGCWNHTIGTVHNVATGSQLAEVKRNYSSFPFSWVEGHANGHDYLVCGENYQGQTVIELDTGNRKDSLPDSAKLGHGFCWAVHEYNADQKLLVVDGCFWGGPYEYKFYDFSDPMNGWEEIEVVDSDGESLVLYSGGVKPEFCDGEVRVTETRTKGDIAGDDYSAEDSEDHVPVAGRYFRREGNRLLVTKEWVDPAEAARRQAQEERMDAWYKQLEDFKTGDPVWLTLMQRLTDWPYLPGMAYGVCHASWHPTEKFDDRRVLKEFFATDDCLFELEMGLKMAPIKLETKSWPNRTVSHTFWFPRTVEGMNAAIDKALELKARGLLGNIIAATKSALK